MDYVVFIILAPLAVLLVLRVGIHVWSYRAVPGGSTLLWMVAFTIGWLVTNSLEVVSGTLASKLFWARNTYFFIAAFPLAWVAFAMSFSGRHGWPRSILFWVLALVTAVTIVVAQTNDWHRLLWANVEYLEKPPFDGLRLWYGPWFWFMVTYSYVLVAGGSALILHTYFKFDPLYRAQGRWMALGAVFPIFLNVIHIFKLIPGLDKDLSPLGFACAAAFFWLGMIRLRIFDVRPVAQDEMLRQMTGGILVVDRQGRIVEANPAMQRLFISDEEAVIGRKLSDVLPVQVAKVLEGFGGAERTAQPLVYIKDNQTYHFQVQVSVLKDQRGEQTGRLFLFNDVTELREAAKALRHANEELQIRNEELDAFAHTVAHDLKNPVHVLQGVSEALIEDEATMSLEDRREFIGLLGQMGDKMHSIIEALMLLTGVRKMPVSLEPLDVQVCLQEAQQRLQVLIEERDAKLVVADTWPNVLGYAAWVEEVWVNYISNAIKYGGEHPRIQIGSTPHGDGQVRFWVRDYGVGIPKKAQANLFVPFTRLHQVEAEGHGLGLAIVRRIMEKLGGEFGMESSGVAGEGSLFYFVLPAWSSQAQAVAKQTIPSIETEV